MFRVLALSSAGMAAAGSALLAPMGIAYSQSGGNALPSVTVEAPQHDIKRGPKKPGQRAAALKRRALQSAAAPSANRPVVVVTTDSGGVNATYRTPPAVERFQLPQQSYSITSRQIEETINLKDPEDAVKYMPDLFVRKRNDGDNQAVLATRNWGLSSSARTLIYYDDLLVSALIGNNNSGASPHWNLISPEAIQRIDFLDGPFAAAYPGNSIGGVLLVTSKMPDKPFAVAKETVSVMPWSQYGTKDTYVTSQTSAAAGNRNGALSWLITANYLDSYQQPLTYTTNASPPANTTGTIIALN
jgi:iron complex outermembrane receptor protein